MKVLSINVSTVRGVSINGKEVPTGIYKMPSDDAVPVRKSGLEGDEQADLTVHGGPWQAVYGYPSEHYGRWAEFLGQPTLPYGTFGENLTTVGLLETEVCVGDIHRVGTVLLQVTSARLPCFKFAHKVGSSAILKPFLESGNSGFYYRVLEEGTIQPGESIEVVSRDPRGITVREMLGLYKFHEGGLAELERALGIEALSPIFREALARRLESQTGAPPEAAQ